MGILLSGLLGRLEFNNRGNYEGVRGWWFESLNNSHLDSNLV